MVHFAIRGILLYHKVNVTDYSQSQPIKQSSTNYENSVFDKCQLLEIVSLTDASCWK